MTVKTIYPFELNMACFCLFVAIFPRRRGDLNSGPAAAAGLPLLDDIKQILIVASPDLGQYK